MAWVVTARGSFLEMLQVADSHLSNVLKVAEAPRSASLESAEDGRLASLERAEATAAQEAMATAMAAAQGGGSFLESAEGGRTSSTVAHRGGGGGQHAEQWEAVVVEPMAAPSLNVSKTSADMHASINQLLFGKTAFGATPMGGSVKKIKLLITDMKAKVKAAHKADQAAIDALGKALAKCGSVKKSGLRGAQKVKDYYLRQSKLHKKCRESEAVKFGSKLTCTQKEKAMFTVKTLQCASFAETARKYGTQLANVAIVTRTAGESTQSYLVRISSTICGKHVHGNKGEKKLATAGWGGGLRYGSLDIYLRAKAACIESTRKYRNKVTECKRKIHEYKGQKAKCNQYQDLMDTASCKRAVMTKDTCESFGGCYYGTLAALGRATAEAVAAARDRKVEWRGLLRMECVISAFADGKVTAEEVNVCKNSKVKLGNWDMKLAKIPKLPKCITPRDYPSTGAYKRLQFRPLPVLAKGKESNRCSGMQEISVIPRTGSPKSCKCSRVTLSGSYSAGAMVKCSKCIDVRRSKEKNSCPRGTKIFAPGSRSDWKTFFRSAGPLKAPHWIVDVTRPQNGCGGCTFNSMNSGNNKQKTWHTSDGSAWWLRSARFSEPNGDYSANCFLSLRSSNQNANHITFNDKGCSYHSKSYYCQAKHVSLVPTKGSPASCKCSKVQLSGKYSGGMLVKCEQCISVSKSTQKNSCPGGFKIFSPQSRRDWRTFLDSAKPLRAPNFIIDVTRPQNGCGGCNKYPLKSSQPQQATWRTSDGSSWWLRSSVYNEPNGDYTANCYLDLSPQPSNENTIRFNDNKCSYRSRSYYCQRVKRKPKPLAPPQKPRRMLVAWGLLNTGLEEETFYLKKGSKQVPSLERGQANILRRASSINYRKAVWPGVSRGERFAVRWSGLLVIEKAGKYRLSLGSDDGSKLYVDNHYVLNNDGLHKFQWKHAGRRLFAGQQRLRIEYFNNGGRAACLFHYRGADTENTDRLVDGRALRYKLKNGFKEEVYYYSVMNGLKAMPDLRGKRASVQRIIPKLAYPNTDNKWPGYSQDDCFAVRWSGIMQVSLSGNYRWSLKSDDGSKLHLDGKLFIDNGGLHGFRNAESSIHMSGTVLVHIDFYENIGHAGMILRYMGMDTKNRMIQIPKKVMKAAL